MMPLPLMDPSWLDLVGVVMLGQFFQALLGGISQGSRAERGRLTDQANTQAELENRLLLELAKSPDPEVQALALTGLLTGNQTKAKGKKGVSGLGGFLTEVQENPILPALQSLLQTPAEEAQPGQPDVEGFLGSSGVTTPISSPNAPGAAAQAPRGTVEQVPGQSPVQQLPPFQPVGPTTATTAGGATSITPGQPFGEPIGRPTQLGLPAPGPIPQTPDQPAVPRQIFRTDAFDEAETTRARIQATAEAFREQLPGVSDEFIARAVVAAEGGGAAFTSASGQRTTFQSLGNVEGNQLPPDTLDSFGRPVEQNSRYNAVQLPDLSLQFFPVEDRVSRQGVAFRDAAFSMGFDSPDNVPQERRPELEQRAQQILQGQSFSRGFGSGLGGIEADKAKPLTATEALQLQVTFGITQGEAAQIGALPLTTAQVDSGAASFSFERDIAEAKALFQQIWPRQQQPEARRLALAKLQRDSDPQFRLLMATLGRMSVKLAVIEQGSRPTDIDVRIFKDGFPNTHSDNFSLITTPSSFDSGLLLLEAAERIATSSREDIGILSREERIRRSREVQGRDGGPPDLGTLDDPNVIRFDQVNPTGTGRVPGVTVPQ